MFRKWFHGWVFNYNAVCPNDAWLIGYWWERLLSDPTFAQAVIARWKTLRETTFNISNIHQKIDTKAALLNESQDRNQERWNNIGQAVWPNDFVGATYQEEVDYLKDWFEKRVLWMDTNVELLDRSKDNSTTISFKFFPIPFDDVLNIEISQAELGETYLRIYNVLGHKVAAIRITIPTGITTELSIPSEIISPLSKGVYFYNLEVNEVLIYKGKLVKQ